MASIQDAAGGILMPPIQFSTRGLSSSTANAGELSGPPGTIVVMNNSGGTPGTYTTRTGAQMVTDSNLQLGQFWWLWLVNGQGTGTLTLAGGASGITTAGTLTVAVSTARLFTCLVTAIGTPNINITGQAFSFTATALAFGV